MCAVPQRVRGGRTGAGAAVGAGARRGAYSVLVRSVSISCFRQHAAAVNFNPRATPLILGQALTVVMHLSFLSVVMVSSSLAVTLFITGIDVCLNAVAFARLHGDFSMRSVLHKLVGSPPPSAEQRRLDRVKAATWLRYGSPPARNRRESQPDFSHPAIRRTIRQNASLRELVSNIFKNHHLTPPQP